MGNRAGLSKSLSNLTGVTRKKPMFTGLSRGWDWNRVGRLKVFGFVLGHGVRCGCVLKTQSECIVGC